MSYQVKRINPFWLVHPLIPTLVAIGGILGFVGYSRQTMPLAIVGGVVAALAIIAATRPAISLVLATVGLFGGLIQFVIAPALNASTYTPVEKLMSIAFYTVFYAVLMDAVVLVVSVLYNFYAGVIGFGGINLQLEETDQEPAA